MAEQEAVTPVPKSPATREDPAQLLQDWGRYLTSATDTAEVFTRQKPLVALLLAFLAGLLFNGLVSMIFRRK